MKQQTLDQEFTFRVRGSRGDEYVIVTARKGLDMKMSCTCQAGQQGSSCKHRFALIDGDIGALISENISDVESLKNLLRGTELEKWCHTVAQLEEKKAKVDKELSAAKKALARTMSS